MTTPEALSLPPSRRQRTAFASSFPRQHGAWSILLASFVLGVGANPCVGWPTLLLFVALVSGFLARHSVTTAAKSGADFHRRAVAGWAAVYALIFLAAGTALLVGYGRWLLIPLGAAALALAGAAAVLEKRRQDRSFAGEVVGTVGLTLGMPLTAAAATGTLEPRTIALWFLAAAFFVGAVFHVRYVVRRRKQRAGSLATRLRAALPSLGFHLAALAGAGALAHLGLLPPWTPAALAPALIRAGTAAVVKPRSPLVIRRLGVAELTHTVVFVALTVAVVHAPVGTGG